MSIENNICFLSFSADGAGYIGYLGAANHEYSDEGGSGQPFFLVNYLRGSTFMWRIYIWIFSIWFPFLLLNLLLQSVCNLGTWCISVQQLEPLIIEDRADPMVTAVVHALDNPFGSLSTTFEAAQVILHMQTMFYVISIMCLWWACNQITTVK